MLLSNFPCDKVNLTRSVKECCWENLWRSNLTFTDVSMNFSLVFASHIPLWRKRSRIKICSILEPCNSIGWHLLVFSMETFRVQIPSPPNYQIIKKKTQRSTMSDKRLIRSVLISLLLRRRIGW